MGNDSTPIRSAAAGAPSETPEESAIYRYEPSGICERSGNIPVWLKLVSFGLIVWGLYYAWHYWNSY
ncbi:hypothetical protein [Nitrospira sp. BLG_2]|uniref:hypothetical protein n=1 Tax=Nitrospira sp. BLG_2 TaxID=3397507 RepID=UPI003B9AD6A4